jgi:hypothetical protein
MQELTRYPLTIRHQHDVEYHLLFTLSPFVDAGHVNSWSGNWPVRVRKNQW